MTADLLRRAAVRAQELADGGAPLSRMVDSGDPYVVPTSAGTSFLRAVGEWLAFEAEVCVNDDGQNEPVRRSALVVARALLGES